MITRISLFFFLTMVISLIAGGQKTYRQTFFIDGASNEKVKLVFYYGDQQIRQDSGFTDISGKIDFIMNDQDDPGMYKIELPNKKSLDFLFNRDESSIATNSDLTLGSLVVSKSLENKVFFDYFRHKSDMETRIEVLKGFLDYYPPADTFYLFAQEHLKNLTNIYDEYLDSIIKVSSAMFAGKIIRLDQLPDIRPGNLTPSENQSYKADYFENIDLTDSLILNTPYLPVKVIDYLTLYIIPGAPKKVQEENFIQAVDSLMKFTQGGARVREMIVNYLIDGFQAYGFETVLSYLVENYVLGQKCVSDQQEEKLRIRVEGFKKLAIGNLVPDFAVTDAKGDLVKLSDNKGKSTLLIFWSGNCPHCEALMPDLKMLYNQFGNKVRFIGISVDQDEKIWRDALAKSDLEWTNVAELKGWDGKIIQDYYVYATPTFLIVDPGLKIKAKPTGLAELKGALMN